MTITQNDLDSMDLAQLDALDFGVVKMDLSGIVTVYNRAESDFSGLTSERVVGRHFFSDVAPCTNNFMVAQKYQDNDELDETIDYVFTLRMTPTPVTLRLLRSVAAESQYMLVYKK